MFCRDDLKLYRDVMTCSTNTYFHSLEQDLKEYIEYDLIKNLLHVSLVFVYFIWLNYPSTQTFTQPLNIFKLDSTLFCHSTKPKTVKSS